MSPIGLLRAKLEEIDKTLAEASGEQKIMVQNVRNGYIAAIWSIEQSLSLGTSYHVSCTDRGLESLKYKIHNLNKEKNTYRRELKRILAALQIQTEKAKGVRVESKIQQYKLEHANAMRMVRRRDIKINKLKLKLNNK